MKKTVMTLLLSINLLGMTEGISKEDCIPYVKSKQYASEILDNKNISDEDYLNLIKNWRSSLITSIDSCPLSIEEKENMISLIKDIDNMLKE